MRPTSTEDLEELLDPSADDPIIEHHELWPEDLFDEDPLSISPVTPGHDPRPGVADSDLSPEEVLERYWGYSAFRPLQREIVQAALDGRDTLGLMPTGGGKSITFQVPGLILPGLTLVITPLISLMKDQVDHLGGYVLQRSTRACRKRRYRRLWIIASSESTSSSMSLLSV